MPYGNQMGPDGQGPRTGRGLGNCLPDQQPNPQPIQPPDRGYFPRIGRFIGRRFGGFGRGFGRGRGMGRRIGTRVW